MKELMRYVCTNGTARSAFAGKTKYDAYGKTGTAEFNSKGGTHSWFTGFATNGEKTIAITVILEDTNLHAYTSASKIFDSYFN
jgi:peptidoglycan glycosyltransferase